MPSSTPGIAVLADVPGPRELGARAAAEADQQDAEDRIVGVAAGAEGVEPEQQPDPSAEQCAGDEQHRLRHAQQHQLPGRMLAWRCAHRLLRCMNTSFSNKVTSCSFLSSAPTSGGTATLSSLLCSASSGMSSATSSLSQSSSSEVDGFFLRPGRLRTS